MVSLIRLGTKSCGDLGRILWKIFCNTFVIYFTKARGVMLWNDIKMRKWFQGQKALTRMLRKLWFEMKAFSTLTVQATYVPYLYFIPQGFSLQTERTLSRSRAYFMPMLTMFAF